MRTLVLANQKGGVGETTTAVNVAAAVAQRGQQVLLVDLDPQGNASMHVLGQAVAELRRTVLDVLWGDTPVEDVALPVEGNPGLEGLPANLDLAEAEVEFLNAIARERLLLSALRPMTKPYDLVVIDTPPSLGLLTLNGLTAADAVVVPVQVHFFALAGLSTLRRAVERIHDRVNKSLQIVAVVPTFYDARESLAQEVMAKLREAFGDLVTQTVIRRNTDTARAAGWAEAVVTAAPKTLGGQDYEALAAEILERLEKLPKVRRRAR
jgi:chromosome partitioning protein